MLVLRTLGGVDVVGAPKMRKRRRELALLCYCAYHAGEWVDRDELAALLWTTPSEGQRAHSLRECLYRLPNHVRGLRFETRPQMIRLKRPSVRLDAHEFLSALESGDYLRATQLYRGEFMKGFRLRASSPFNRWREEIASKLGSVAEDAFGAALANCQMCGDWLNAERLAHRLTLMDRYDETAAAVYIRLLIKRGAEVQARRELEKVTARLRAVDKAPGAALAGLQGADSTADAREWYEDDTLLPLVGRDVEFNRLRNVLLAAEKGPAAGIVLDGHAGNGKTRLMQQVLRFAVIRGNRVLQTTCGLFSPSSPYAAIRSLLQNLSEPELAMLPARHRAVIMEGLHSGIPRSLSGAGVLDQVAVFDAVASLLEALAAIRPVVLFLDDLHRIDTESAELVRFLRRRLKASRVLFAGALRSDSRRDVTLLQLLEPGAFESLPVNELSSAGADALISAFLVHSGKQLPRRVTEMLARRASGNPFYLLELLSGCGEDARLYNDELERLPPSLEQYIAHRLARLTPEAAEVAAALAVLGGRCDAATLERVAGYEGGLFLRCVDELCNNGIARDQRDGIEFVHEITRETVYTRMLPGRKRALHSRAARALLARRPLDLISIALHFEAAGDRRSVVRYGTAAAVLAEKRYGPAKAVRFWKLVASNGERTHATLHARERLAACQYFCGATHEAIQSYEELLRGPTLSTGKEVAFRARLVSLSARHGMKSPEGACEELLRAALGLPSGGDKLDAIQAAFSLAMTFDRRELVERFQKDIAAAVELAGSGASRFVIMMHIAEHSALSGRFKEASAFVRSAERYSQGTVGDSVLLGAFEAMCCYLQGHAAMALHHYLHTARQTGNRAGLPLPVRLNWSLLDVECARFSEAESDLSDCVDIAEASGNAYVLGQGRANLAWLAFEQGRADAAIQEAKLALDSRGSAKNSAASLLALGVLGLSQLESKPAKADLVRRDLRRLLANQDPFGGDLSYAYIFLARMAEREGKWGQAMKLVEKGIGLYSGRDFFCHGRLELEKARLLGARDAGAALELARAVRGRALEAEAVLMLNKSEALIRQLKRAVGTGKREQGSPAAPGAAPGGSGLARVSAAGENGGADPGRGERGRSRRAMAVQ